MIHLSSILAYLCISITQISFHQFFSTYFTKHVQTHNYPTRNAQDYNINKTKKMFSDCAIRNCGPSFWNSLNKKCKTTKHFQNRLKSVLLSEYNWFHFWGMSCVFLCRFVCMCVKCIFVSLCIFFETFVRAWLSQAFLAFWSCPQYHVVFYAFVLMYDIGIKFWYDMIWYDMIWYDMIWYDMIWYMVLKNLYKWVTEPFFEIFFLFFF